MKLKGFVTVGFLLSLLNPVFGQGKKSEAEFKKMCSEIVNAFAKKNVQAINKYLEPSIGIYVIARPGAMDVFTNYKKLDTKNPLLMKYPYKDTSMVKKHTVNYGTAPKFNCGSMKWDKEGFFADSSTKYIRISDIMYFRTRYENAKYSNEDVAKKDLAEKQMRKVVFTQIAKHHGLVFYMSFLKGKWYLTVVDTTEASCAS